MRARLFVGRDRELAVLHAAVLSARDGPVVACLHGPAGVGKSTLLRTLARQAAERGVTVALVDLSVLDGSPESLLQALAYALRGGAATVAAVVQSANRRAASGGLALCLDAYDTQPALDRWLRAEVLYRLGPGSCVVIASRADALRLWPDDENWRAVVRDLALGDLSPGEAEEYLVLRGVHAPAQRARAAAVSGGRPLLLGLCADVLLQAQTASGPVAWPEPSDARLATRLLDRLAGAAESSSLRTLVDAASVVRTFDPAVLTRMVGGDQTRAAWEALVSLPVVTPAAGRLTLHDEVRDELRQALHKESPWRARRWRRRAIDHHLERARYSPPAAAEESPWGEISHLASDAAWYSWLHSANEDQLGWRFERGATVADLDQLVDCWTTSLRHIYGTAEVPAEAPMWTRRLFQCVPEGFLVARGRGGEVLGYSCAAPLRPDTEETLLADPAIGAYLGSLPEPTLRSWHHRLLACCQGALRDPSLPALFAIVRETCREFAPYGKILFVTPEPGLEKLLELLQFSRQAGFEVVLPGLTPDRPAHAYILDLDELGYANWLTALASPATTPLVPLVERGKAAREALSLVGRADRREGSAPLRYFRAMYPWLAESRLDAWALDALRELEVTGFAPLAELLRRYDVERAGTHEELAEQLDLSRRTYFRRRVEALRRLGDLLYE